MDPAVSPHRCHWLITDVDATITGQRGELSLAAAREMRRLEERGISVGLVSGRPYPMIRMLGEYLGLSGPLIAENGGVAFCGGETLVLGDRSAAEESVRGVARHMTLAPAWDNAWRMTDYAVTVGPDVAEVRRLASGADVHVSSMMIHFSQRGVDKASAVTRCLGLLGGRKSQVLVAGDSGSDLSLFERFEQSIAPANASEEIATRAAYLAASPYAEGFVEGIEHFRRRGLLP